MLNFAKNSVNVSKPCNNLQTFKTIYKISERFLERRAQSNLPNSIIRELNHLNLAKHHYEKKVQLAPKKGCSSVNDFQQGDKIRVQHPADRHWKSKVVIFTSKNCNLLSQDPAVISRLFQDLEFAQWFWSCFKIISRLFPKILS